MDMSSIWQSLLLGSGKPNVLCTTENQLPRFIANVVQKICTHVFLEKQKMESLSIFSLKNTNQIRNKRQHKIHPKMEKTNTKTNRHPTVVRYRLLCFFCFLCCPPFFLRIVYIFAIVERNVSFLQQIIEQSYTQCCFLVWVQHTIPSPWEARIFAAVQNILDGTTAEKWFLPRRAPLADQSTDAFWNQIAL